MARSVPLLRRALIAGLAALATLGVAACGDDDDSSAATEVSGSDAEVAASEGTATTSPPAEDEAAPEGRGIVTDNADGTRTVTSKWGAAIVPAEPRRIVSVLGYIDFESMLALDIRPIAAGTQGGTLGSGFAPHLDGLTDGVEPLAWADGAPAEAIAALQPDLIFAPDAESADLLDEIAPTVPAGAANGLEWKEDFRYIAAVLGRSDDAETLLAEYENDASGLAERLAPAVDSRTVASPQVAYDHTQVYLDNPESFSSAVLTELDLDLAPVVTEATDVPIAISFERLTEIDADILFWQVRQHDEDGSRDSAGFQVAQDSPLWSQVPAVAAGAVFEVDNRPWYFPTILAARRILVDVEDALL